MPTTASLRDAAERRGPHRLRLRLLGLGFAFALLALFALLPLLLRAFLALLLAISLRLLGHLRLLSAAHNCSKLRGTTQRAAYLALAFPLALALALAFRFLLFAVVLLRRRRVMEEAQPAVLTAHMALAADHPALTHTRVIVLQHLKLFAKDD